jgi:mannose-1-phosphate guanylyltransferase
MMSEAMADKAMGNATLDDTCENTNVINELDIPVLVMGAKNMVVAASCDGILVSDKEQSGYMKPYVDKISTGVRYADKSWGTYTVIDVQPGAMTVRALVHAGSRMTYQSHDRRDEVWTIASGTGTAVIDGMEQKVRPGDVISIAAGCKHTIIADPDCDLGIIEIQIGDEISAEDKTVYPFEG